jgi:murein L,D-transpeptidase YcbB/YkuD
MRRPTKNSITLRRVGAFGVAAVLMNLMVPVGVRAAEHNSLLWFINDDSGTSNAIRRLVEAPASQPDAAGTMSIPARVAEFYRGRDFSAAWSGGDRAEARAEAVMAVLQRAAEQGLHSTSYTAALKRWTGAPAAGKEAAAYDVALTTALFQYALDVRTGRTAPRSVYADVTLPPRAFDVANGLASALRYLSLDAFLARLPPGHPGYQTLVRTLAHYRVIAAQGGWPTVSAAGANLSKRLALDDAQASEVEDALKRFQKRNGLEEDGKLGASTLAALNVPVEPRIRQIIANMERWRWLPDTLEPRHITVNVPDQSLDFVEDGQSLLHSRVIIGRKTSRTPILRAEVVDVVANPSWNVPDDIAARSIVPHLRQDAHYLAAHNMVLTNAPLGTQVNWVRVKGSRLPYQIQQMPGPNNGLGVIMLDSPNPHFVYMHDTPKKELFEQSTREISNGCVRVEQIQALASLVLGHDPADDGELQNAIALGSTAHLTPRHPVPVYMLYWTAVADPDGAVGFRPDRYNRDAVLADKMFAVSGERAAPKTRRRIAARLRS